MFFFYALDILQHIAETATRVQCHFSLESQRKHAEEVDVQVESSLKIVISGLRCKIGHQSTAILKTFGDFSLVVAFNLLSSSLTEWFWPGGGGTPYIPMIGMIVVFFRGWNRRFGIF